MYRVPSAAKQGLAACASGFEYDAEGSEAEEWDWDTPPPSPPAARPAAVVAAEVASALTDEVGTTF
jgi:hypothetical protein